MTTTTPNLSLVLYDSTTDQTAYFSTFRAVIAGVSSTSNFYKIDTAYGDMAADITALQNSKGAVLVPAGYVSANYYEANSITEITAYTTNMSIILKLDTTSAGTVTLNINALGTKSVMKINSAGTAVNITGAELVVGKYYLFMYDGTRWVWVDANSADQIYVSGTSGNFLRVSSANVVEDSGSSPSTFAVAAKGVTNGDSHDHVGGDGATIVEAAITLADNTTNNSSTSKHGFLKKLSNVSTEFMNGAGNWATPAGSIDVQTFSSSGTWTKPASATMVMVVLYGAGGGGGEGASRLTSTARGGGGGGGGGARTEKWFRASDLSGTVSVTIGAGGTGGSLSAGTSAQGMTGLVGGNTTFGSYTQAGGGGGGAGGYNVAQSGGTGGGVYGAGNAGSTSTQVGGTPAFTAGAQGVGGQGAGSQMSNLEVNAEYGGGAGGAGVITGTAGAGGSSISGAGGGGGGGGYSSANASSPPNAGGLTGRFLSGGGGAAGTNGASPTAGTAGSAGDFYKGGTGGGGGGACTTDGAAAGGNGGSHGGGGGGGGGNTAAAYGGVGGNGGAGYAYVVSF